MRHIKRQFLLTIAINVGLVLAISNGCSDHHGNVHVIDRFPAQVGNSWEYRRIFSVVVYDTVNGDTTEYSMEDSLHEEFEAIDTLAGWECYRLKRVFFEEGNTFSETWWYAHPDSALLWIANLQGYVSKRSEKSKMDVKLWFRERSFDNPRQLARYLHEAKYYGESHSKADTSYWYPPKKLFIYPLDIDANWVAMTVPWLEQREIMAEDSIIVPAGTFFTLAMEIVSDRMQGSDSWYNWIADKGIIKDVSIMRGTATDINGNIIGYYDSEDTYELLDYQVE